MIESEMSLLASWLACRVLPGRAEEGTLAALRGSAWGRLALLRAVLESQPMLARAARHLSVYDQFRLSVELVGATTGGDDEPARVSNPRRPMRSPPMCALRLRGSGRPRRRR